MKIPPYNTTEIINWIERNNYFYKRFCYLSDILEYYLINYVLVSRERAKSIAENLLDVIKKCNTVDYNKKGVPEAYTILHFLDRYHRFQLISKLLLKYYKLPIKRKKIDIIGVGTGPAPSLFAISDIYTLLKIYGKETNKLVFKELKFKTDYVENSYGWRNWLHRFLEFANGTNEERYRMDYEKYRPIDFRWSVPYQHGSFNNAKGLDFRKRKQELFMSLKTKYEIGENYFSQYSFEYDFPYWRHSNRYNLVIFSNFFTQISLVNNLKLELRSFADSLRKRGLIIIVGAKGDPRKRTDDYHAIYDKISLILEDDKYYKKKSIGFCKKIKFPLEISYEWSNSYGKKMQSFYKSILNKFEDLKVKQDIPTEALDFLENRIKNNEFKIKWATHIFRKGFIFKKKYKK